MSPLKKQTKATKFVFLVAPKSFEEDDIKIIIKKGRELAKAGPFTILTINSKDTLLSAHYIKLGSKIKRPIIDAVLGSPLLPGKRNLDSREENNSLEKTLNDNPENLMAAIRNVTDIIGGLADGRNYVFILNEPVLSAIPYLFFKSFLPDLSELILKLADLDSLQGYSFIMRKDNLSLILNGKMPSTFIFHEKIILDNKTFKILCKEGFDSWYELYRKVKKIPGLKEKSKN